MSKVESVAGVLSEHPGYRMAVRGPSWYIACYGERCGWTARIPPLPLTPALQREDDGMAEASRLHREHVAQEVLAVIDADAQAPEVERCPLCGMYGEHARFCYPVRGREAQQ